MKILLLEDDTAIASALTLSLQPLYQLDWAHNFKSAQNEYAVNHYDFIIADLYLPDGNGMDFCRHLRARGDSIQFLVITGNQENTQTIKSLLEGADDYLRKPFHIQELHARIHSVMRRAHHYVPDLLTLGNGILDKINRTFTVNGSQLTLTRNEFDLLLYLGENKNKPVSTANIIDSLWDSNKEPFSNTIEVHICRLRQKFKASNAQLSITSRKCEGYTLRTSS